MSQNKALLEKRPLLAAFLLFGLGVVSAQSLNIPFSIIAVLIIILFIFACLTIAKGKSLFFVVSGLLILVLGMATYINFNTLPKEHISYLLKSPGARYYIRGRVKSEPIYRWQRWGNRRCNFTFQAMAYKQGDVWLRLKGLSKAQIDNNELDYNYGDDIVAFVALKSPVKFANKSSFDYVKYLKAKGIYTIIDIEDDENVVVLKKSAGFSIRKPIYNIRRIIEKRLKLYLPYPDNTLISAMLLASRHSIPKYLRELFVKTGSVHVLSVSGLHVAIISTIIFFMLKACRLSRKISSVIVIIFVSIYAVIAQERTPILRASIMITIYLLSYILERDFDIYTALSLAGLIILIINPMQIFSPGFILSFACVFSLVYLTPKFERLFTRKPNNDTSLAARSYLSRILQYIKSILFASLAVFIGVWPITAIYFGIISPISIIANIFIIPLLGVILFLSIILVCVPILLQPISFIIAHFLHSLLGVSIKVLALLSETPFAYFYVFDVRPYMIILYYVFVYVVVKLLLDRNMM